MPQLSQFKAEFFKALAHPLRIRILDELRRGEVGVNELCLRLDVEQSTLSQQLAILRNRSIVVGRKDGQSVFYSVRDPEILGSAPCKRGPGCGAFQTSLQSAAGF